jgi:hypothetical protein
VISPIARERRGWVLGPYRNGEQGELNWCSSVGLPSCFVTLEGQADARGSAGVLYIVPERATRKDDIRTHGFEGRSKRQGRLGTACAAGCGADVHYLVVCISELS